MKRKFLLIGIISLLFISTNAYSQDWGLGIRLGDPSGITIKKYMDGKALELSIGRTHLLGGKGYYDKQFNNWYADEKTGYKDSDYIGYKASAPIGFQLHYLIQKGISKVGDDDISGLEWYFGFGGQVRFQTYTYDYRYKLDGSSVWLPATSKKVTDLDLGADGVIGLEYTFKEVPISLFLDATLFMEIFDNPFLFWMQGGIGGRYRF